MKTHARPRSRAVARPPEWLAGDWSPVLRDPIDVMRLALLVAAPVTYALGPREQSVRLVLTFLIVLVPRALDVPRPFDLAFVVAMSFQAWGNVFGAFDQVYGYDKVVHFILPCATSPLVCIAAVRLRVLPELSGDRGLHDRAAILLVTWAFGLALMGGLYELYEWFANRYLGAHLYVSYGDSVGDLLDDSTGALLGGLLIVAWDIRGWGTRRRVPGRGPAGRQRDPIAAAGDRALAEVEPKRSARAPRRSRPTPLQRRLPAWGVSGPDALDLVRATFAVGALAAFATGAPENGVRFLVALAAVLAVRALDAPSIFDLAFTLAMGAQAWGAFLGVFDSVGGYGPGVHVLVSAAAAPVLYIALVRLRLVPDLAARTHTHERIGIALIAFCFAFSAGILYELYVYAADHVLGAGFGASYSILIGRLGFDAAGALGAALLLVGWNALGWGTRRCSTG